jgi:hypothetical protein
MLITKTCHFNNDQILALTLECIKSEKDLKTWEEGKFIEILLPGKSNSD